MVMVTSLPSAPGGIATVSVPSDVASVPPAAPTVFCATLPSLVVAPGASELDVPHAIAETMPMTLNERYVQRVTARLLITKTFHDRQHVTSHPIARRRSCTAVPLVWGGHSRRRITLLFL